MEQSSTILVLVQLLNLVLALIPLITKNVKLLLKYKNLKTRLVKVKAKNFEYVAIMSNI